ncbi:MAG: hypothetical protein AAFX99_28310, partial [Myxococcota bacterium]
MHLPQYVPTWTIVNAATTKSPCSTAEVLIEAGSSRWRFAREGAASVCIEVGAFMMMKLASE